MPVKLGSQRVLSSTEPSHEPHRMIAHGEKLNPMLLSQIAGVFLVRRIVPMLKYAEAAASYAIAFRIAERLRRRIVCQSGFGQVVVCIRGIHEIGPF